MAGNWITGQRPLMHRVVVQAAQAACGDTSTIWWYIQAACGGTSTVWWYIQAIGDNQTLDQL